jgi:hypothetical protein
MRKLLCTLGALVLLCPILSAQPDLSKFIVAAPASTTFLSKASEVPPWIIGGSGDWRSYFFVDGINSFVGSAEGSMISNNLVIIQTGPTTTTSPTGGCPNPVWEPLVNLNSPTRGVVNVQQYLIMSEGFVADAATTGEFYGQTMIGHPNGQDWRKNYYAIYSANYFVHPTQGPVSIGFIHAENKTNCNGGNVTCQNTIDIMNLLSTCPGGEDWERYNSFVCASWIPNTQATNSGQQYFSNDMGPIVWPSTGYLQPSGVKFTTGVNVPSSIQSGGYMYLFFHDSGPYGSPGTPPFYPPPGEEGRYEGVKVARAPLSDALNPRAWQVFYRDPNGVETWHPSLPQGFTREAMAYYWNLPGPKSTVILGNEATNHFGGGRFSVAQVRNTNYFIGVESYTDLSDPVPGTPGAYRQKTALRYSTDLVHWTDRQRIIETVDSWTQSNLNYPALLGSDGWSNNLVDANDFYVVGTNSVIQSKINKVHIYLPAGVQRAAIPEATANANLFDDLTGVLTGIYPNPGNGVYQLSYTLTKNARVQINVLDITGRRLLTGAVAPNQPGAYLKPVDITAYGKGVYLVELLVNGSRRVYKVVYN